jgi:hypothetical protein
MTQTGEALHRLVDRFGRVITRCGVNTLRASNGKTHDVLAGVAGSPESRVGVAEGLQLIDDLLPR